MAAIAGRVMPITRGQYNSETTYEPLDFVTYNNALWGCIKQTKGNAPTEGQYWKKLIDGSVSDASSLGGETATQWQTKIDNIQTTSRATLSQAGWYRVAEYKTSGVDNAKGNEANSCKLTLKVLGTFSTFYEIALTSIYSVQEFNVITSKTRNNVHRITKVRYTVESGVGAYLEVYFTEGVNVAMHCTVDGVQDYYRAWKAITPTLTAETVDGVTVTTTYDIPSNASPVTDLDLAQVDGTEVLNTSILEKAVNLENGFHVFRLGGGSYTGGDLPATLYAYGLASVFKWGGNIVVELHGHGNSATKKTAYNYYVDSAWKGWDTNIMQADLTTALASYFKNTGGEINGDIEVKKTTTDTARVKATNSTSSIGLVANESGGIYDFTNGKWVLENAMTPIPKLNGVASGNLPLTGGTVKTDTGRGIKIQRQSNAQYVYAGIDYGSLAEEYGSLGFDRPNVPIMVDTNNSAKKLLHEGNYTDYAIAKNGGGEVTSGKREILTVARSSGNLASIAYKGNGSLLGELGFDGANMPAFYDTSGTAKKLHHDGNSAKVLVQSTPLTEAGSIRVW